MKWVVGRRNEQAGTVAMTRNERTLGGVSKRVMLVHTALLSAGSLLSACVGRIASISSEVRIETDAGESPIEESDAGPVQTTRDGAIVTRDGEVIAPNDGSAGAADAGNRPPDGSTPRPDGGVHVVMPCPTGSTGQVGVWENVTPDEVPQFDSALSGVWGVVVAPSNPSIVYLGTDKRGIFRSEDCGAHWTKVNTGANGALLDTGTPWTMAVDADDPNTLFANNGYGAQSLWRSRNGGRDWTNLFPPESLVAKTVEYNFASVISMDPADSRHLLVSFHNDCAAPYNPTCMAETTDAGDTWRLMVSPATNAGSLEGAGPIIIEGPRWLYALPFGGLYLTENAGGSWRTVTAANTGGAHYQLYRGKDAFFLSSIQGVITSTDQGSSWRLIPSSGGQLAGLNGDGMTIITTAQNGGQYWSAKENMPNAWSEYRPPGLPNAEQLRSHGGYWLEYDRDHHIMYSSNSSAGLWRAVTY